MKRTLEDREVDMANWLMLLSRVGESSSTDSESTHYSALSRVFECKTCNRKFMSFQALGGHRASHKKPELMSVGDFLRHETSSLPLPAKPKTHECLICGLEFAIGKALGGHMRRHRAMMSEGIVAAQFLKKSKWSGMMSYGSPTAGCYEEIKHWEKSFVGGFEFDTFGE